MSNYQYFKYSSVNKYLIESLIKRTLYFASPGQLNDPFDCDLNIKKSIENALPFLLDEPAAKLRNLLNKDTFFKDIQEKISKVGVCSFSLTMKQTLMWCHYANNHRGVCILYDIPPDFLDDEKKIIGVSEVSYEENVLTNWFVNIDQKLFNFPSQFVVELAKQLLTAKAPAWSYEKEARIIRSTIGPCKIPKEFIKQICFGLQTSPEDKELIRLIMDSLGNQVTFCEIVRTDTDYGIDADEI